VVIPGPNVVVLPLPFGKPSVYGELGKVLDYVAWKAKMTKPNGNGEELTDKQKKTLEEVRKLSPSDQKLWLMRKLFEIIDHASPEDVQQLYDIISKHED
jgi:DNA-directed RNA polymerase subunit F